jgi:hypothetical protein
LAEWKSPQVYHPWLVPKKTRRKNITMMKATVPNKWVAHVSPIQSMEELQEFIALWEEVTGVQRVDDAEDEIKWKWTPDGQYTTKSAYRIQFLGRRRNQHSSQSGKREQSRNAGSLLGFSYNTRYLRPIT